MGNRLGQKKTFNLTNLNTVPDKPGIYLIRNKKGDAQYIGMTKSLKSRLQQHLNQRDVPAANSFQTRPTKSTLQAEKIEGNYIKRYKPAYNIQKSE